MDIAFDSSTTNETVYSTIAKPLIPWVFEGGIATLFAFGQTGSGKTFTMSAIEESLALDLFQKEGYSIYVSFLEMYQNQGFDLLNNWQKVDIMEDSFGAIQLKGIKEIKADTPEALLKIVREASAKRRTETTEKNHASSRSHLICKIRVVNLSIPELEDGCFYIVDLAGSESSDDTKNHTKQRIEESKDINRSLATLKDCIRNRALCASSPKHVHVPYRSSKPTHVLKDVFEIGSHRQTRTVVIANVSSSIYNAAQTLNTLRYIAPLKVAIPKPKLLYRANDPCTWSNAQLKEWIRSNYNRTPPIDPDFLAPTESGKQLLRISQGEFVNRCMKTKGVEAFLAISFYNKFWSLHVDARLNAGKGKLKERQELSMEEATFQKDVLKTLETVEAPTTGASVSKQDQEDQYKLLTEKSKLAPGMFVELVEKFTKNGFPRFGMLLSYGLDGWTIIKVSPSAMEAAFVLDAGDRCVISPHGIQKAVQFDFDHATRFYFLQV